MKKKLLAVMLGIALSVGIIGLNGSNVSAEPDTDPIAEEEAEQETAEETDESVEEDTESDAVKEEETDQESSEETESEEETEESTEEAAAEEDAEKKDEETEITGMKVVLENNLELDIISVEAASFMNETYTENLLKKDQILEAGKSCTIGIPEEVQDADLGMYNVRITTADGVVEEIPLVPLLEQVTGTVYRENDTVLIMVRDDRLEAESEQVSEAEIQQVEAEASQVMAEALSADIE